MAGLLPYYVRPPSVADTKTVFCYWGSWSSYRWGEGELRANQINAHTCTHLVYAFAGLNERNEIYSLDPWNDLPPSQAGPNKDNYRHLVALKQQNPQLKVLLSIGGWNQASSKFSKMVYYENSRRTFIQSVMSFLPQYGFEGLDIAWQWPFQRGGMFQDKANYVLLLQELRKEFQSKSYVLSIAAPAIYSDSGYDLPGIMKHVDFVSVYAYDYSVNPNTLQHGSPLYNSDYFNCVSTSIKYYLDHGATAEKLLLGVTLYSRSYKLKNPQYTNVGDGADGFGNKGPFTQEQGLLAWFELCSKLKREQFTIVNNSTDKTSYAYNTYEWISYESEYSLKEKVAYAKTNKLAGITVWSMDNDDNHKICGASLTSVIANAIKN
uniref:GH18 domain-containing protein n=1 Tax=Strigamia maritima TaxID=126957 RepID=T1J829_STRMM